MMVSLNHRLGSMLSFELEMVDTIDPLQEHDPRLASVESITKWYNQCLENGIRKSPDQYWWVHRRWREPPPRLRKKANLVA
jgi:KDO2-lipid IV(A) lauroyltransferase